MRRRKKNRSFLIIIVSILLSANSIANTNKIIFECPIYYNGTLSNNYDTILVYGINDSMLEVSGSATNFQDSTFTINLLGDSLFNLLDNYQYLQFEYVSAQYSCKSVNINFTVDTTKSTQDVLFITEFKAQEHYFYYSPYVVCQNSDIITPVTDIPIKEILIDTSNLIVFDSDWNILPAKSTLGDYIFGIYSNYCLNSKIDSISLIESIINEEFLIDTIKYCSNAITLSEDFSEYSIYPQDILTNDSFPYEHTPTGYHYFKKRTDFCTSIDSAYIKIIEPKTVSIFSTESCMDALLQFETTAQDFDFIWWNNDTDKQTHTDKSGIVWIEITDENNCIAKDSIDIILKPLSIENLNYAVVDADCWEDGKLTITDIQMNNLESSYLPTLKNKLTGSTTTDFELIPEGIYSYQITDSEGCKAEYEKEIMIVQKCLSDYPVFTPDNDGVDDEYFIPHEGNIKIFDRNGSLLRTIETPAYWDGRDNSGNLLPMGNYIMLTNTDRAVNITIVR